LVEELKKLQISSPDIQASAIVSIDGLIIASALPHNVQEDRVSAMSAAMLSLGERISQELRRGNLDQVYIRGDNGYVMLIAVGEDAVLTVLAGVKAKLGLIFLDIKRTAAAIEELI
jgi:predicted regulator of Ras-like GTPase activity (Roadblock/LC7/MglB family)